VTVDKIEEVAKIEKKEELKEVIKKADDKI